MKATRKARTQQHSEPYKGFDQINGEHPWQKSVPEGSILYPTRRLKNGNVTYFNFILAKEMGLIPRSHQHQMNRQLEQKVLSTFNLRIINEYDQQSKTKYPKEEITTHPYMATRYLQLQHPDKTGRTSGDGRGIWNGTWTANGTTWDISSRGTGVTALAPGVVKAGKPLPSGCEDYGYSCGMAEVDELYACALLSEVFHRNGYNTERILCVIDIGNGVGVGVRAGKNLLRPAHLFLYLKQNRLEPLKRAVDFMISRQFENGNWKISPRSPKRYSQMLDQIAQDFGKFSAHLDRDYVFAWLDWDGDNVLTDAGIIDYGSVRQFGLRHDQYKYDDVDRYSTNLNQQKQKAQEIIQTFAQLVDFLESGDKKPIQKFKTHSAVKQFEKWFKHHLLDRFIWQLGFPESSRRLLLSKHRRQLEKFYQLHTDFESTKTYRKMRRVPDGVNRPAIFNMRAIMSQMPAQLLTGAGLKEKDFFKLILSQAASPKDRKLGERLKGKIKRWQRSYSSLVNKISTPENRPILLHDMAGRANVINREDRATGNALISIVEELVQFQGKTKNTSKIQPIIEEFVEFQTLNPDYDGPRINEDLTSQAPKKVMKTLLSLVQDYSEDI